MTRNIEALKNLAYSMDPSMVRALKFMRGMDDVFAPYKNIMEEMKERDDNSSSPCSLITEGEI